MLSENALQGFYHTLRRLHNLLIIWERHDCEFDLEPSGL
jgi:hypothetical protein